MNQKLLEQRIIVKTISDKVIVRYECEHESFAFAVSRAAAMQLSGMLEAACKNIRRSKEPYEVGISI